MVTELNKHFMVLVDYLALNDEIAPSDAIFLFGGYNLGVPKHAAALYHAGYANCILVAGKEGLNPQFREWSEPIFERYSQHLQANGVAENAILVERKSRHTLEDVLYGIPILENSITALHKIILVTADVHQRRAWATIAKQYPQYKYLNAPYTPNYDDLTDSQKYTTLIRALGEIRRLQEYGEKQDIVQQNIPETVLDSYHYLVSNIPEADVY